LDRATKGRSQTFSFGGATGGASFATRGAVNGLCRTFRKRPEKFWGGHWEGQGKFWGGSGPPGTPLAPSLVLLDYNWTGSRTENIGLDFDRKNLRSVQH